MRKAIIYLMAGMMAATSCVYPFEPEVEGGAGSLVIEGSIIIGGTSTVEASYVVDLETADAELGKHKPRCKAWIEDENGKNYPQDCAVGYSLTIPTKDAPADLKYRLHVGNMDTNKNYVSEWQYPTKAPEVTKVYYTTTDTDITFKMDLDGSATGTDYFRWDYKETWEFSAYYIHNYTLEEELKTNRLTYSLILFPDMSRYYCWKTGKSKGYGLAVTKDNKDGQSKGKELVSMQRTDNRIQYAYKLIIYLRGLSKDSYEYLDNLDKISDVEGSLFSPSPSDMAGNISCTDDESEMVYGFVEACEQKQHTYYYVNNDEGQYLTRDFTADLFIPELDETTTLMTWYNNGYSPVDYYTLDEEIGQQMYWAANRCFDCTMMGGTKNKPENWPTKHE